MPPKLWLRRYQQETASEDLATAALSATAGCVPSQDVDFFAAAMGASTVPLDAAVLHSVSEPLPEPASAHLKDLSLDYLDGFDGLAFEDLLNVSRDSFLNISFPDSQPPPSALTIGDYVIGKDSQTVSATVVESSCSVSREDFCSTFTSVTFKAEVHASADGTSSVLLLRKRSGRGTKRKYWTRQVAKTCHVDRNFGFNDISVTEVASNASIVKTVKSSSGPHKKSSTLDSVLRISHSVFDPYDDANAFVTQKVSHARGRKRTCKAKSSKGAVLLKKFVSAQSPVVSSSSDDISALDLEFEGFEDISVTEVASNASIVKTVKSSSGLHKKTSSDDISALDLDFEGFEETDQSSVDVTDVFGCVATQTKN